MSQFTPLFRPPSSNPDGHEPELHDPSLAYSQQPRHIAGQGRFQEQEEPVYSVRNHDAGKLKKLSFWGNNNTRAEEDDEWTERPSPTPFILIMVILVVVSSLVWFMFRWASGNSASPPPVILPDSTPFKVRPENPGGVRIPHQDKLIYGRLRQDPSHPVERLLPPPEQPLMQPPPMPVPVNPPLPTSPMPPQAPYPVGEPYPSQAAQNYDPRYNQDHGPSSQPYTAPVQPPHYSPDQLQGSAPPAAPYQPYATPPDIRSAPVPYQNPAPVMVPYDQPHHAPPSSDMAELGSPGQQVISPVEGIKPATEVEEENPLLQEGRQDLEQLIAREAKVPLKRVPGTASKTVPPKALKPGDYKVQIASLPSRAMAELEMKRLRASHGAFLESRPWNIQKIELGSERGVTYRLVIGSFANRESAVKYCKKLQARKIGCMVVAPATK